MSKKGCYNYCDGYCFYHGDTGEVCDKIQQGTLKHRKDGYCPMEVDNVELEEQADAIVEGLNAFEKFDCSNVTCNECDFTWVCLWRDPKDRQKLQDYKNKQGW